MIDRIEDSTKSYLITGLKLKKDEIKSLPRTIARGRLRWDFQGKGATT
jgi:hypothetical protein